METLRILIYRTHSQGTDIVSIKDRVWYRIQLSSVFVSVSFKPAP